LTFDRYSTFTMCGIAFENSSMCATVRNTTSTGASIVRVTTVRDTAPPVRPAAKDHLARRQPQLRAALGLTAVIRWGAARCPLDRNARFERARDRVRVAPGCWPPIRQTA